MGFLALVALATAIGPLVFDVSPATDQLLTVVEWVVLGLFVTEFVVQFTVAEDRERWLRSSWRIVDAICIVGPLLSLLPQVSDTLRGALVFRFLRVGRAVAFGARAGALAVQKRQESGPKRRHAETRVTVVTQRGQNRTSYIKLAGIDRVGTQSDGSLVSRVQRGCRSTQRNRARRRASRSRGRRFVRSGGSATAQKSFWTYRHRALATERYRDGISCSG